MSPTPSPLLMHKRMSVHISCPPGTKHCTISGKPDQNTGTIHARAIIPASDGNVIALANYTITEDFVDSVEQDIPEGLHTWYPKYSGGDISPLQKKADAQTNFQHLFQDFLCNHAFAHLVLKQVAFGEKIEFSFYEKDIPSVFRRINELPSEADFLARAQKIVRKGHAKLLHDLTSSHVALFYGVTYESAESFLMLLMKQGLIENCCRKTGFHLPYGTRNAMDCLSCIDLTKDGLAYKSTIQRGMNGFIAMPFKGLEKTYSVIQAAWKEVFGDAPLKRQDSDPDKGGRRLIDEKILKNIEGATLVIADLSLGARESSAYASIADEKIHQEFVPLNPNVMFEVGYAVRCVNDDADSADVLFLAKSPAYEYLKDRVFDLRNRHLIHYDDSSEEGIKGLHEELVNFFRHFQQQTGR